MEIRKKYKNNTSGFRGVYHHKDGGWVARIKRNNKRYYLGFFQTIDEAIEVRVRAETQYELHNSISLGSNSGVL